MMDAHPKPRPISEAPCDGTMLRLWVRYPEGGSWTPLDDARESWTIGFNNRDNTDDDRWQVVGWCWSHDHLVEASSDVEILGWLPFHGDAPHDGRTAAPDEGAAEQRDNEPLKTDEGGCVTKRFVIFNRPGMAPEKKGGWLKDEYLIDFLREAMLLDCWAPGFRATVLELTWNNDLWASSASEYLSAHDHAIGPRRARRAWGEARDKHERIYKTPPSMPLGQEIATYHLRTSPSPTPATDAGGVWEATGATAVIRNEQIVISIDVDALPGILSGSIATNAVAGLFKVTDPAEFANEVCGALNAEKEDGTTRVHKMFDSAFNHAIDQGAEGVEEVSEDEFEAEAQRIQSEALAALRSTDDGQAAP